MQHITIEYDMYDRGSILTSTAVQARRMLFELKDNFVHLESSNDSLDQDCTTNGSSRHANVILTELEDIIPETSFEIVFHLGEIEVRTLTILDELLGIVEEIETKVEERARHRLAINLNVWLVEMPASWSTESSV